MVKFPFTGSAYKMPSFSGVILCSDRIVAHLGQWWKPGDQKREESVKARVFGHIYLSKSDVYQVKLYLSTSSLGRKEMVGNSLKSVIIKAIITAFPGTLNLVMG